MVENGNSPVRKVINKFFGVIVRIFVEFAVKLVATFEVILVILLMKIMPILAKIFLVIPVKLLMNDWFINSVLVAT